jgi:predicted ribosomally synthesized peptide with SipW-like signal peptide
MAKKFIFLFAGLGLLAALFIPNSTFAWFSARDTDDTQAVTAGHVAVTLDKKFAIVDENGVEITGTNADEAVFMPSMIYIPNSDKTTYTGNPTARYEM